MFRRYATWRPHHPVRSPAHGIVAPELFDVEVLHRLLQMGQAGRLTAGEVEVAVADLRDAPIRRLSHRPLLAEATRLGAALSGYDALYAAAAVIIDQPLWTADPPTREHCPAPVQPRLRGGCRRHVTGDGRTRSANLQQFAQEQSQW